MTVGFGSPAVGETAWKCSAAEVTIIVGRPDAEAGRGKDDAAVFAAVEWAFAIGCERRKWSATVKTMLGGSRVGCRRSVMRDT